MAGRRGFPVQFLYWPDSDPELAASPVAPYLAGNEHRSATDEVARGRARSQNDFASQDAL